MPRQTGYSLRTLKSGRTQVLIRDPAAKNYYSLGSFADRDEAEKAGERAVAEQKVGTYFDPRKGEVLFADYWQAWLDSKSATGRHSTRTTAEAQRVGRLHVLPVLGRKLLVDVTPPTIRSWHDKLVSGQLRRTGKVGAVPAKAYRLVAAVFAQAVRDELIPRTPCLLAGAGAERADERPLVELADVEAIAEGIDERWRALVLVAAYCGLRFGEIAGLQRKDVDLLHRTITVDWALSELDDGSLVVKRPKTAAGRRVVAVPAQLVPVLERHLAAYAEAGAKGYMFVGPGGGLLRRSHWGKIWRAACREAGVDAVRFHDLRHMAGTMFARTGATTREIQARLGHRSPQAAHRYQHAAQSRDQELAEVLDGLIDRERLAQTSRKRPHP